VRVANHLRARHTNHDLTTEARERCDASLWLLRTRSSPSQSSADAARSSPQSPVHYAAAESSSPCSARVALWRELVQYETAPEPAHGVRIPRFLLRSRPGLKVKTQRRRYRELNAVHLSQAHPTTNYARRKRNTDTRSKCGFARTAPAGEATYTRNSLRCHFGFAEITHGYLESVSERFGFQINEVKQIVSPDTGHRLSRDCLRSLENPPEGKARPGFFEPTRERPI